MFKLKPKDPSSSSTGGGPIGSDVSDVAADKAQPSGSDGDVSDVAVEAKRTANGKRGEDPSERAIARDAEDDLIGELESGFGDGEESY